MTKLRFVTLTLAALGMAPGVAHLLELPVKMGYSPEIYAQVTSTLYALFGSVAAILQVGAFIAAGLLTYASRRRPEFVYVLLGTICLAVSLLLWTATVAPVNAEWARSIRASPDTVAASYAHLRARWEYGHVAAFIAWLTGYCSLQWSACSLTADSAEARKRSHRESAAHPRESAPRH